MSSPSANTEHSTLRATSTQSQQPTPTTSVNQAVPADTSPGGQSSRQSNDINESAEQFDAANLEGHTYEGEPRDDLVLGKKLAIQVAEGKKRPDVPLQAAKLASKTGVALRDNMPIYTSWKLYDNDAGKAEVKKVLDKVASRLDVDVKNEARSKVACTDIIKRGVRQTRYHLKKKYFNESLTEEQLLAKQPPPKMKKEEWTKLVEYWCDPKNQRTKYSNMEPDAIDFFGECMSSPQNGRTLLANEIYEQMVAEKEREPEEGEEQKSQSKIVADCLSQIRRSSTFLPNIGVPRPSKTGRSTSRAAQARLQAQFEETLQAQREEAARK
ncbi:unnamed protein product [Miscanthus lutarioriparius]|uniref:Uncharacterized protein n=1 Tax=Miscanthus lutarioriparius TaxID=422564 RepID=A0A811QQP3_9POAL|nr:unnamed protein product [Miscanthus lutarioriparius]